MELYRRTLEGLELRDGVTEEQALDYFALCMELFNDHFQARAEEGGDYRSLQQDHEEKLLSTLDMMLYGIAKQP